MNLADALKVLKSDHETMGEESSNDVSTACDVLIANGLCPNCFPGTVKLREWQDGDYYRNAGRECPDCEEFYVCGPQPEYELASGPSDADPGL